MIEIKDINDSRIEPYRRLKKLGSKVGGEGIFVVENDKVIEKALKSNIEILSFFALPKYYKTFQRLLEIKNIPENKMFTAKVELMNRIVGFKLHQGIMAVGKTPDETPFSEMGDRVVAFNAIVNSENVGSIVRNCASFAVDSIICDKETSSPFLRRAVRVSAGAAFFIKRRSCANLAETLIELRNERNYRIIGMEINENAKTLDKTDFNGKIAIVFGSEGKGLSDEVIEACDEIAYIPIDEKMDSLNVAASSAIVLNSIYNKF